MSEGQKVNKNNYHDELRKILRSLNRTPPARGAKRIRTQLKKFILAELEK